MFSICFCMCDVNLLFMKPAALLLSSPVVSLTSSFRTLFGILLVTLLISTNSYSQIDSCNKTDTNSTDQLELSAGWGGGHGGELGVTFNNFSIHKIFGDKKWDPLDSSSGKFLKWDTLKKKQLTPEQKKKRIWLIGAGNVVGYGGVMTALASAWYDNYTKTKLHSFNDSQEWLQVDKVGHLYGTWIESRANSELWKWAGMERKKRIWISGLTSFVFQTTIEYLDGKSAEWGWSWSDFGANILGSGIFIAQELAWNDQRIKLKWSFHRKHYSEPTLNQRSDELFGKSSPERFLKDYNGQTYWASINLKPFIKNKNFPAWLSFAIGYGAEGMFGGTENFAKDINGNITFNRPDIKRYRQWYLSPDIDLSKIKTNSKAINFFFTVLSAFKFPLPSIEFSNGKFKAHAIHF